MLDKFDQIIEKAQNFQIYTIKDLEKFRLTFLVKKGLLNQLVQEFKLLPNNQKKEVGKILNTTKKKLKKFII